MRPELECAQTQEGDDSWVIPMLQARPQHMRLSSSLIEYLSSRVYIVLGLN